MTPDDIKFLFERKYGLSFDVDFEHHLHGPVLIIRPSQKSDELFSIEAHLYNRIRLVVELHFGLHSAWFVRGFSDTPVVKQNLFYAIARNMKNKSGLLSFKVNDIELLHKAIQEWPIVWDRIDSELVVKPFPEYSGDSELLDLMYPWLSDYLALILSIVEVSTVDDNQVSIEGYEEGSSYTIKQNRYERNPKNRALCLAAHGYACKVCGMDFQSSYGEIGRNFIQVHHITPVSQMGSGCLVDPLNDLIPVCPNCHAMLHKQNPPLSVEALRSLYERHHGLS